MRRFGRLLAACAAGLLLSTAAATAAEWAPPLAFPIRADAATRSLVAADGQKVLVVGEAAWSLIVQLNQAEVQQYLDDRRNRGFNTVLVNLIEHKFAAAPPANAYGEVPFLTAGDFSTPNPDYFAHAEWVVEQAYLRGMLVLLAPMYLGYQGGDQGWYQELKANGQAKALAYGRYVGQRFARFPNLLWVQGGDMPPSDVLAEIEAVVSGIREGNGVIVHTAHSERGNSSLDDYNRPWLGLNSGYTTCEGAQAKARAEWQRTPAMPYLHIEGIYENEGASEACLLGQVYYSMLGGARGHVFGNRPMWLFDAGWQAALGSRGAQLMQHAAALLYAREGASLVPDLAGSIVVTGAGTPGSADYAAAAKSASGRTVIVYIPRGRTIEVNTALAPGPQYRAWWYNPRNGLSQDLGLAASGPVRAFGTPSRQPWVLVLEADTTFAPPDPPAEAVSRYNDPTKEHPYTTSAAE